MNSVRGKKQQKIAGMLGKEGGEERMKDLIAVAAQEGKPEIERVLAVKEEVTKELKRMEPQKIIDAITSVSFNRKKLEYEIKINIPYRK